VVALGEKPPHRALTTRVGGVRRIGAARDLHVHSASSNR
jgi:hypothetical protein